MFGNSLSGDGKDGNMNWKRLRFSRDLQGCGDVGNRNQIKMIQGIIGKL